MKKILLSVAAAALCATTAVAADLKPAMKAVPPAPPPSPWDIAFGAWAMSDYNFRGISQSDRGPSATVYSETRFNATPYFQLYAGSQTWAVDLPTHGSAEVDFWAGIRPTLGPVAFDFGFIYYWYPKERQVFLDPATLAPILFPTGLPWTVANTDYWEVYGKASWDAIKDRLAIGGSVYYSDDWLKTGSYGLFASGTAKVTLPSFMLNVGLIDEVGWYLSGEVGHYWFGTTSPFFGSIALPDYTTWNVGLAFTWKVFTLDLRYYDTDLTTSECFTLTGDLRGLPGGTNALGQSKWCNQAFIATLKFDLTLANLK